MIVPVRSPLLLVVLAASAAAQTTTTARRPVHRTATAPVAVVNPADNPPNVPRVAGTPKPLYALRYVDTVIGTGPLAEPQKYYTVRYTGWLTNGTKFDSSDDHPGKDPITFPYGAHRQVIAGWDTGFRGHERRWQAPPLHPLPARLRRHSAGPPSSPSRPNSSSIIELVSHLRHPARPQDAALSRPNAPRRPGPARSEAPSQSAAPPASAIPPTTAPPVTPSPPSDPTRPTAKPDPPPPPRPASPASIS